MTRPLVLIVDADDLLRWALREVLVEAGFTVHDLETARAVRAWMGRVRHHPPTVAVVDYVPGTPGRELLATVKAEAPQCHILTMTTDDSVHLEREAVAAGAAGVLVKPFDLVQMVSRIRALVRSH